MRLGKEDPKNCAPTWSTGTDDGLFHQTRPKAHNGGSIVPSYTIRVGETIPMRYVVKRQGEGTRLIGSGLIGIRAATTRGPEEELG